MSVLRALIAEDEPVLAAHLQARLTALWPELQVVAVASNGQEAARLLDALQPEVAFLDIRMPGLSGLEVAQGITHDCQVVFVTAYDQYAVEAFDRAAVDYLLKPVSDERLGRSVARLKQVLEDSPAGPALDLQALVATLAGPAAAAMPRLEWIRAARGDTVHLLPVADVAYFQSADKYTQVMAASGEYLIRTPLRELLAQLDPGRFWQIHRGTIVNAAQVAGARHDLRGRLVVALKGRSEELVVSRPFEHLFRQM